MNRTPDEELLRVTTALEVERERETPRQSAIARLEVRQRIARRYVTQGIVAAISMAAQFAQNGNDSASSDPWERARMETEAKAGRTWLCMHDEEIVAAVQTADAETRAAIIRDLIGA